MSIDVFINYQDVWFDSDDLSWYFGPFDDALTGCVLVNPRMSSDACLAVGPVMSGSLAAGELLQGVFTVKPNE
jgi:hypothetical protein